MKLKAREAVRRIFDKANFIKDVGYKLESVDSGACTTSLEIQERHLQQDGFVHAGVQATMADHTAGAAAGTLVEEGQIVLSAEFKINLLRAAKGTRLICRAKVLKPGRRLTVVEAEVFSVEGETERMTSKMTATMAIVDAPGRTKSEEKC